MANTTISYKSNHWHTSNPNRYISGEAIISTEGTTVKVNASGNCGTAGYGHQSLGLTDTLRIVINGSEVGSKSYAFPEKWSSALNYNLSTSGSKNVTNSSSAVIEIYMHCSDSKCPIGANVGFGHLLGSATVSLIQIPDPYPQPGPDNPHVHGIGMHDSPSIQASMTAASGFNPGVGGGGRSMGS